MLQTILDNAPRLIAILILTGISGLISASETALFSLSRQQLNRIRHANLRSSHLVISLRNRPSELLSTVLLCNIFVNILLYSILGVTAGRLAADSALGGIVVGVIGFLLVLFGAEIIPKLVAFTHCETLAPVVALPLRGMEFVTSPLRWILSKLFVTPLTRIFNPQIESNVGADDLQRLLDIGQREGLIDNRENILLHQMLDLSTLRASSVMTPRVDVVAMDVNESTDTLRALIQQHRLLRIPIYDGQIDNILGIVSAKQCLLHPTAKLRDMIRPVQYVPEQASCEAILRHFRKTNTQLALVVDEYGGLAGLVAMEDVVEAIVGELRAPEERSDLPALKQTDDTTFMADASIDVHDFRRAFGLPAEDTRIHTLGGLIVQELGRVPWTGDEVNISGVKLAVTHMRDRRILRVRIALADPIDPNPDLTILLAQVQEAPQATTPAPETEQGGNDV